MGYALCCLVKYLYDYLHGQQAFLDYLSGISHYLKGNLKL